jgi:endoglucanase
MQLKMGLGINLGNTLDAPAEGSWAPKAQASFFAEYKAKGFTNVRIPIQWGHHLAAAAPYGVDPVFMDRVAEVVGWCLAHDLVCTINTHHDEWLEDAFASGLPRFASLWKQIAVRFANASENLLFEVYNEPHAAQFTADNLNAMNARVLPIIRAHNPKRIVIFGGLKYMNPSWIVQHPDALTFPANDTQLMLEFHNYDPFDYAGGKAPTDHSWGSDSDYAKLRQWMDQIGNWSQSHNVPVFYGEFGCTTAQNKASGRYTWYKAHAEEIKARGFAAAVWDDDGGFRVFDRNADTWDEELLAALGRKEQIAASSSSSSSLSLSSEEAVAAASSSSKSSFVCRPQESMRCGGGILASTRST